MRAVYDRRRQLMVELMRGVGFDIPVMPQGAFSISRTTARSSAPRKGHHEESL